MGLIQELWNKVRGSESEPEEEPQDEATRDKYLRSLRREDRVMDEAEEKEYLKRKIAARKKIILRKEVFGIKDKIKKKKHKEGFLGQYRI